MILIVGTIAFTMDHTERTNRAILQHWSRHEQRRRIRNRKRKIIRINIILKGKVRTSQQVRPLPHTSFLGATFSFSSSVSEISITSTTTGRDALATGVERSSPPGIGGAGLTISSGGSIGPK